MRTLIRDCHTSVAVACVAHLGSFSTVMVAKVSPVARRYIFCSSKRNGSQSSGGRRSGTLPVIALIPLIARLSRQRSYSFCMAGDRLVLMSPPCFHSLGLRPCDTAPLAGLGWHGQVCCR